MSMAGIKSDQTEAATMTPEAKPRSAFWISGRIPFFMKYTQPAPAAVPANGMKIPSMI